MLPGQHGDRCLQDSTERRRVCAVQMRAAPPIRAWTLITLLYRMGLRRSVLLQIGARMMQGTAARMSAWIECICIERTAI